MFRAEAIKILLIIVGSGWCFVLQDIVHAAFFAAFVITVAVFAAAIAVRDHGTEDRCRDSDEKISMAAQYETPPSTSATTSTFLSKPLTPRAASGRSTSTP
jgi:hypothetical protein